MRYSTESFYSKHRVLINISIFHRQIPFTVTLKQRQNVILDGFCYKYSCKSFFLFFFLVKMGSHLGTSLLVPLCNGFIAIQK